MLLLGVHQAVVNLAALFKQGAVQEVKNNFHGSNL